MWTTQTYSHMLVGSSWCQNMDMGQEQTLGGLQHPPALGTASSADQYPEHQAQQDVVATHL